MRTLYTELFSDFLTDNETTPEWVAIQNLFANFPAFYIEGVRKSDGTITSVVTDSLYDLFVARYDIYEIGGETEDLFVHAVRDKIKELTIKYMPKIAILSQIVWSVDATTKKSQAMSNHFEMVTTDDFKNTGYIYPINTGSTAKMSGRTDNTGTRTEKRPLSQASWTELTKEVLSLPDTYNDLLDELGACFMVIL